MKERPKITINLLSKKEETSFINHLVFFLLHYLRYIVVITQIIVIVVFFLRIVIDQEIIDLEEKISEKKEIIKMTKPLVQEGEKYSFELFEVKKILDYQNNLNNYLSNIFSSIPRGVYLNDLSVTEDSAKFSGRAKEAKLIKNLYLKLTKEKKFKEVIIDYIDKKDLYFDFKIYVKFI